MKHLSLLLAITVSLSIYSQEIVGTWQGVLKIQGIELPLVFHISKTDNGFSAMMDSPAQGAKDIPATSTVFDAGQLKIAVGNIGLEYSGNLGNDGVITGTFKQMGQSLPLDLNKVIGEITKPLRPQEPVKPYSYYEEEVLFKNEKANVTLSGTLTLPTKEGVFPAVVMITGSGAQNRDKS